MDNNFNELKDIIESKIFNVNNFIQSTTGDGRLESAESESLVRIFIQESFPHLKIYDPPKPRYWYDMMIEYKGKKYPINIKITSNSGSADNVSSKIGMFYALTGIWPEGVKGLNNWTSFNQQLIEKFNPKSDSDYYFVICFKETGKLFFTSLKQIKTLVPNGNNLPFQCNWSNNIKPANRSIVEQSYYIINTFIDSFIRKANGLDILLDWRNCNGE